MALPVTEIKKSAESIIYNIEQAEQLKSSASLFTVKIKCPRNYPATKLVLRSNPTNGQVQNVKCDGILAQVEIAGTWIIPAHSQHISWEILISDSNEIPLSDGKSIKSNSSILFSEASSLPRYATIHPDSFTSGVLVKGAKKTTSC